MEVLISNDGFGHSIIFSRQLPKTAITKEINVNGKLLQRYAGAAAITTNNSFEIQILYRGTTYPVTCRRRRTGTYNKWVLACTGWLKLVRANDLHAGDTVTLFKPMEMINQRGNNYDNHFVMEDVSAGELRAAEALLQLSNTLPP